MISCIFSPGRMPVYDRSDIAAVDQRVGHVDDARRRHARHVGLARAAPPAIAAKTVSTAGRASAGSASSPASVIVTGPPLRDLIEERAARPSRARR